MNEQEVLDRAGFQILMAARAHVGMHDEAADRVMAEALLKCRTLRPNARYVVGWRTFQSTEARGPGQEIVLSDGKKKYTYFKDYSE